MASNFKISTELNASGIRGGARDVRKELTSLKKEADSFEKAFKKTGNTKLKADGIKSFSSALQLAERRADDLRKALNNAKMNGAPTSTINSLTAQLRNAETEARNLGTSLNGFGDKGGASLGDMAVKAGAVSLAFGGVQLAIKAVTGVIGLAVQGVKKFASITVDSAKRAMDLYDSQQSSMLTLSYTLADGAKGAENLTNKLSKVRIDQRGDLLTFSKLFSSSIKLNSNQALGFAKSVNNIGDALGESTDSMTGWSVGLTQALGVGTLHAQDYNQMMNNSAAATVLLRDKIIDLANKQKKGSMSVDTFKTAMEKGAVSSKLMKQALSELGDETSKSAGKITRFEQVKEIFTKTFDTSFLTGFQTELGKSGVSMEQLGTLAGNLATSLGTGLGGMLGNVAKQARDFVEANGGIPALLENIKKGAENIGEKLKTMFNGVMTPIGAFLSVLGYTNEELTNMGWKVDAQTGKITGWSATWKQEAEKSQKAMQKVSEQLGMTGASADEFAQHIMGPMQSSGNSVQKFGDDSKKGAKKATGAIGSVTDSVNTAIPKLNDFSKSRTAKVSTTGAKNNIDSLKTKANGVSGWKLWSTVLRVNVDTTAASSGLGGLLSLANTVMGAITGAKKVKGSYEGGGEFSEQNATAQAFEAQDIVRAVVASSSGTRGDDKKDRGGIIQNLNVTFTGENQMKEFRELMRKNGFILRS